MGKTLELAKKAAGKATGKSKHAHKHAPAPKHEPIAIKEKGSFTTPRCVACGWEGNARRSRDKARRDGSEHLEKCKKAK